MNSLNRFATAILTTPHLEAKLQPPPPCTLADLAHDPPDLPALALADVPDLPGRPEALQRPGKATFPDLARLHEPQVRGEVLHFFANHELLALELMALALLRFPQSPPGFRLGLLHTIAEEQDHLRLYLARMAELGVAFGDLPLSDYFWKAMKSMQSPLQFVTQMALTVEQANLDFAAFYSRAMAAVGDATTAGLLDRVYREEIGHVKHGLTWFNRWRKESPDEAQKARLQAETEWQAYLRLLPPPMTAKRAKGLEFTPEARREAGFSEDFIRHLALFGGSKGRPPVVWLFNPHCDAEIARGRPGFTPTRGAQRLARDLGHLPAFLALDQDVLWTPDLPRPEWIESLQDAGFATPEFADTVRAPKLGGIQPWGWSPDAFARARGLRHPLTPVAGGNAPWCQSLLDHETFAETGLGPLFSKAWSVRFLRTWLAAHPDLFPDAVATCGQVYGTERQALDAIRELLAQGRTAMVKAPYGTAGMQVRQVRHAAELQGPLGGWILKTVLQTHEIIVEPWLAKHCDLSMQCHVDPDRTRLFDGRRFLTGSRNEYRGAWLGRPGLDAESLRLFHELLPAWRRLVLDVAGALRKAGYNGPAGVDALLWRDGATLRMKPLVEVNPRWTMGRVAWALEKHLAPGVEAMWLFLPVREILQQGFATVAEFADDLRKKQPLVRNRAGRLQRGVVFTNDPARAQQVVTVLVVGADGVSPTLD